MLKSGCCLDNVSEFLEALGKNLLSRSFQRWQNTVSCGCSHLLLLPHGPPSCFKASGENLSCIGIPLTCLFPQEESNHFQGLPWLGQVHPDSSPFLKVDCDIEHNLIVGGTTSLYLLKGRGLYRVCTPGGKNLGGHLRIWSTTSITCHSQGWQIRCSVWQELGNTIPSPNVLFTQTARSLLLPQWTHLRSGTSFSESCIRIKFFFSLLLFQFLKGYILEGQWYYFIDFSFLIKN